MSLSSLPPSSLIGGSGGAEASLSRLEEVVNRQIEFDPDSPFMQYLIREQVPPRSGETTRRRHGWAQRLSVEAKTFDFSLTLDGINRVDVRYGSTCDFKMDPADALRTIRLGRLPGEGVDSRPPGIPNPP